MPKFYYQALPVQVYFGAGEAKRTQDNLKQAGYHKILLIATPGQQKADAQPQGIARGRSVAHDANVTRCWRRDPVGPRRFLALWFDTGIARRSAPP